MPSERVIRLLNDDLSDDVLAATSNIEDYMSTQDKRTVSSESYTVYKKVLSSSIVKSYMSFCLTEKAKKNGNNIDNFSKARRNGRGRSRSLVPIRPPNLDSLMRNMQIEAGMGLRPKHIKIVRDFIVNNESRKELGAKYGLSPFAIQYILTLPGAREMMARFQESVADDVNQLNQKAIENARGFLDSPVSDIKLDMTKFILTRATAVPKSEVLHRVTGADGVSPIEVVTTEKMAKTKLLTRSGVDIDKIIEAEYVEVK